jgi:hypothetical protein
MVSVLLIAIGIEISLAAGIHTESHASFSVVSRTHIIHSHNPIYVAPRWLPTDSSNANPLATVRARVVSDRKVTLLAGGAAVRTIRTRPTPQGLIQVSKTEHGFGPHATSAVSYLLPADLMASSTASVMNRVAAGMSGWIEIRRVRVTQ